MEKISSSLTETRSTYVLGLDIETSGSSFSRNGILSIGCSLQDENSNEEACFKINVSLPVDRGYEKECLENFWLKYPKAHQVVQAHAKPPKEAMKNFCDFLDQVEEQYPDLLLVSDNPSFDIAWVNTYLSIYTNRKPLNYAHSGAYRAVVDSASIQKAWLSIKTGDFFFRHGHLQTLGYTSKWAHDHTSLNDARRLADFFNQAMREMSDFTAKPSKKIEVVPYDPTWNDMFVREASAIRKRLGNKCLDVHHIGSTSIPGLTAKPIIDIILEAKGSVADQLEAIGYHYKGEFNIPLRALFGKKEPYEVNLHVYEPGNPEIELNLKFRDFLRTSEVHRLRYEVLKIRLAHDPSSQEKVGQFTKYALGKNEFITDIITKIDFKGVCPRFCTHYAEWDAYHTLRQRYDDRIEATLCSNPLHQHLVLYQGADIIGAVHIDASKDDSISEVKFFHIGDAILEKEVENKVKATLEKWSDSKGRKLLFRDPHEY